MSKTLADFLRESIPIMLRSFERAEKRRQKDIADGKIIPITEFFFNPKYKGQRIDYDIPKSKPQAKPPE